MKRMKQYALLGLALCLVALPSFAARTVIWDKTVIPMELIVGVEQLVHFEGEVSPGLSPLLSKKDYFRVLSSNGTVYMTALQAFDTQRVKFRTQSGEFVLVDLSAKSVKTPPHTVDELHVVLKQRDPVSAGRTTTSGNRRAHNTAAGVTSFDVIRYGVQSLYSPARVIKPVSGIADIKMRIKSDLRGLYKGRNSQQLSIKAVKGWSSNGIYVTALKVINKGNERVLFDPSRLQHTMKHVVNGVSNQFEAVAMLNESRVLGARREASSTTYVMVVTNHPFSSVLDI